MVKEKLLAVGLLLGASMIPPALQASAQAQPSPSPLVAQVQPTVKPTIAPVVVAPKPATAPAPATTAPTPRAGGFPMELAMPLLAGGAVALGGGTFLLRRGKKTG